MSDSSVIGDPGWLLLLLAFGGSLVLVSVWSIGLLTRRRALVCPRWLNIFLVLLIAAVLLVDAQRLLAGGNYPTAPLLVQVCIVSFALLALWMQGLLVHHAHAVNTPWRRPALLALVLSFAAGCLALFTGWLGGELVDRLAVGVDEGAHLNAPSSLSGRPVQER